MDLERAGSLAKMTKTSHQTIIYEYVKLLRNYIRTQQVKHLEEPLTVEKLISKKVNPPKSVTDFFSVLYSDC